VRREEAEPLPKEVAALHAEEITDLQVVERVLRQRGVNAVLELRALPDEHHPGPREIALVAQLARWNPDRCAAAG
jgi:hypothetical protein